MSKTKHRKILTKHKVRGRANIYGLCCCGMCRAGRKSFKQSIRKLQHRLRTEWKGGKEFVKGLYTD